MALGGPGKVVCPPPSSWTWLFSGWGGEAPPLSTDTPGPRLFHCSLISSTHRPEIFLADLVFSFTFVPLYFTNTLILWVCQLLPSEHTRAQTPPEAGSESAPEAAHGALGSPFSEISQRKMPTYSAGERKPHTQWDTGILCYSFFKTKGNYPHATFGANHGH